MRSKISETLPDPNEQGRFIIPKEYRSDVTYGANVKAMAVSLYSEGVMSNDRIAVFLNSISNEELCLSEGSVYGFCKKFAGNAKESIRHLETDLLNQNVVATDATTMTVNGQQNYVRNFSTEQTVLYCAMKSKTIEAMREVSFLKKYTGILVHDHETALYHFGTDHGECNVHLLRYLRKNTEDTGHEWSKEMVLLLCEMNRKRKELITQGIRSFSEDNIITYEQKYHELIAKGREENKKTAHNMSERDLRKAKNRQKMAGGFRKDSGHEMYCDILSIIETLKRRKMGLLENIKRLFMGAPAIF